MYSLYSSDFGGTVPAERIDGPAISLFIGEEPWAILSELERLTQDIFANFSRWDGAAFDSEGFILIGRVHADDGTMPFFIVVKYLCNRGGWNRYYRDQLAVYLTSLGLGTYLERDGHNRFLASISVSE